MHSILSLTDTQYVQDVSASEAFFSVLHFDIFRLKKIQKFSQKPSSRRDTKDDDESKETSSFSSSSRSLLHEGRDDCDCCSSLSVLRDIRVLRGIFSACHQEEKSFETLREKFKQHGGQQRRHTRRTRDDDGNRSRRHVVG